MPLYCTIVASTIWSIKICWILPFVCVALRISASFKKSLNNVRTAGCKMPLQLYTQGILTLQRSGLAAVELFDSVGDLYGVEEGLSTSGAEAVQVPIMRFQLLDDHYEQLRHATDPLRQSDNFGIDIP